MEEIKQLGDYVDIHSVLTLTLYSLQDLAQSKYKRKSFDKSEKVLMAIIIQLATIMEKRNREIEEDQYGFGVLNQTVFAVQLSHLVFGLKALVEGKTIKSYLIEGMIRTLKLLIASYSSDWIVKEYELS